ncbi:MAG: hypothetical protein WCT53_02955, partial [Candidatus Gracilibacteria bacterium]
MKNRRVFIKRIIIGFLMLLLVVGNLPADIVGKNLSELIFPHRIVDKLFLAKQVSRVVDNFGVQKAEANTAFTPSTGQIVVGTDAFNGWRQTLMPDNVGLATFATTLRSWAINTTASGLNVNLTVPNVDVSGTGTNKLLVNTRWQTSSASLTPIRFQICDWVSATGVNAVADAACSTGGWRTLNFGKQDITPVAGTMYWNHKFATTAGHGTPNKIGGPSANSTTANSGTNSQPSFEVFDGYFSDASTGTAISTPLTNFVSSGSVKVRVFSTVATASLGFAWDYLSVEPAVDTSLLAYSRVITTGSESTPSTNNYSNTFANELTTGMNNSITTTTSGADFYYKFKNANTYIGANAVLVNYAGNHSATGLPVNNIFICNFATAPTGDCPGGTSAKWEQLDTAGWDPGTTLTPHNFSKYSATIGNYISGSSEIWVRIKNAYTTAGGTVNTNYIRATVGSVNDSTGNSEVTLGALVSGSLSTNTQTMDTTVATPAAGSLYQVNQVLATQANLLNSYAYDCVGVASASAPTICATTAAGAAMSVSMPLTQPATSTITGVRYAMRYRSNASVTTITVLPGIRDYGGASSVGSLSAPTAPQLPQAGNLGGFVDVGTLATSTMIYSDGVVTENPQNKIDTSNNRVQMRLRTAASTLTAAAATPTDLDFAFMSIRWRATASAQTTTITTPNAGAIVNGTNAFHSWKQAIMPDNVGLAVAATTTRGWVVNTTGTGLNINMTVPNVDVSGTGTNKLLVNTRWQASAATLTPIYFQICDTVSLTGVNAAADAECAGVGNPGGWRTLNFGKQIITPAAGAMYWNHRFATTAGHGTPNKIGGPSAQPTTANAGTNSQPSFEVYDGYFADASTGVAISTPLTNFVSAGNVKVRVYSTVATASLGFTWDYLAVEPAVDTSLLAYARVITTGSEASAATNNYGNTQAMEPTALYHNITTTTGGADFYYKFKNAATYTDANAILINYAGNHSASGLPVNNIYICNFATAPAGDCPGGASAKWEQLDTAGWDPSTTLTTHNFSKYSATIGSYISGTSEIWVRIKNAYTTAGGTVNTNYIRVTVGSVNDSTVNSEVSVGALVGGSLSTNTQTLDTTVAAPAAGALYQVNEVLATQANLVNSYGYDCVGVVSASAPTMCATTAAGAAMNVSMPLTPPANSTITGIRYASRYRSNSSSLTTITVLPGIRDYGGASSVGSLSAVSAPQLPQTNVLGGFVDVGTLATSALIYSDGVLTENPWNKIDTTNHRVQMRLRTAATTLTAAAATPVDLDFAFMSIRWRAGASAGPTLTISKTAGSVYATRNSGATAQSVHDETCTSAATCAAFTLSLSSGSETVNTLTFTEVGTASAQNTLSHVAVYYDTDGNWADAGAETLFGQGTNNGVETAYIPGTLSMTSGNTYYLYLKYDLDSSAPSYPAGGETVSWSINAGNDVGTTGSPTKTGAPQTLTGTQTVLPNATGVTYDVGGDGGRNGGGEAVVSGYGFGVAVGANRADCTTATINYGCVKFIVGGTTNVASGDFASWSNTQIRFNISATLASDGGVGAVEIRAANQASTAKLTYYIYPHVTGISAASFADGGYQDGTFTITGDHLGSSGGNSNLLINGVAPSATTPTWSSTSISNIDIPDTGTDSGTITVTRFSDSKASNAYGNFYIYPQITSFSGATYPDGGFQDGTLTINGNHFGTGGVAANTSVNGSTPSSIGVWSATSITLVDIPNAGTDSGSITVTNPQTSGVSNSYSTFYIYPQITGTTVCNKTTTPSWPTNAARIYDATDTACPNNLKDGHVVVNGNHLGAAGTITVMGNLASQVTVAGGPCASSYSATCATIEMPAIGGSGYTGDLVVTRTASGHQNSYAGFRVLPRIASSTPFNLKGARGDTIAIAGNHFCQSGSCPTAFSAADKVSFTSADVTSGSSTWANTSVPSIVIPAGATDGAMTVLSNTSYVSNELTYDIKFKPTVSDLSRLPASGSTDQSQNLTLTGSTFADASDSPADTFTDSEWQVDEEGTFVTPEWSDSKTNVTTVTVNTTDGTFAGNRAGQTDLACGTTYSWRFRYKDNSGVTNAEWSDYSSTYTFSTPSCGPNATSFTNNTEGGL